MVVLIIRISHIGHPDRPQQNINNARVSTNDATSLTYLAIFAICLLPLIIQFYTPTLNAIFKRIPLIGATTSPMRWLIMYLPVVPIATVLIARVVLHERTKLVPWVVSGAIVMLIISNMLDKREYYHDQTYRPDVLLEGFERLTADRAASHRIHSVGQSIDPETGKIVTGNNRNDIVVDGISQARCYNPSFGYRLEKLPSGGLIVGDVFTEHDGRFNIRNPACYVFPDENECKPGDRFRVDQKTETEKFVTYFPFAFKKSFAQQIADVVTIGALLIIIVFVLVVWPLSLLHRWRCKGWETRSARIRNSRNQCP